MGARGPSGRQSSRLPSLLLQLQGQHQPATSGSTGRHGCHFGNPTDWKSGGEALITSSPWQRLRQLPPASYITHRHLLSPRAAAHPFSSLAGLFVISLPPPLPPSHSSIPKMFAGREDPAAPWCLWGACACSAALLVSCAQWGLPEVGAEASSGIG